MDYQVVEMRLKLKVQKINKSLFYWSFAHLLMSKFCKCNNVHMTVMLPEYVQR